MNKFRTALLSYLMLCSGCSGGLGALTKPPKFSVPGSMAEAGMAPDAYASSDATGAPMPEAAGTTGSLWRSGPQSLFGDRRARDIGDIVTVLVEIDDEAEMRNRTERSRDGSQELSVPALLGVNTLAQRVLPGGAGLDPAIDASGQSESRGDGTIKRKEKITLRVAATVVEKLNNGHLVVRGSQEVRVNYELRDLRIAGVIRTEDISRSNVVTYDKIADARISYGGRGQISEIQKARVGQQIVDIISPF